MSRDSCVVVLDDDPTGTQSVHGVSVVTRWDQQTLALELDTDAPGFFVLTNTRALNEGEACRIMETIGRNLTAASAQTGRPVTVISRSDSTLRGHFPAEVDALAAGMGTSPQPPILICPYFEVGGRITSGDIHYLMDANGIRIPVADTEFARDATFGYVSSSLKAWVAEKTAGRVPAEAVHAVALETIRTGGAAAVAAQLSALPDESICILNCETPDDLRTLVEACRQAETVRPLLYRTASSFAAARIGIVPRPLLTAAELDLSTGPVLTVVGSYVAKSTAQLSRLIDDSSLTSVEVSAEHLRSIPAVADEEIARTRAIVDGHLSAGRDVVLYTSRVHSSAGLLDAGSAISQGIVRIVRGLTTRPRCLIAKGGITSSDLATKALHITRAQVLGQIAPGVAVWKAGDESRWPGLTYIVFPGNVGDEGELQRVFAKLRRTTPSE